MPARLAIKLHLTLWLAALLALGQGQTATAQSAHEMLFRPLAVADGLSQNTVMDVLQDSLGYMWFATENGLDRYDGYSVHSYRRGNSTAGELANDYIWQIAEDERSNLWLATDGGGVAYWDRNTDQFRHFRHDPDDPGSLPSDSIRALTLSTEGLWVASLDGGLALLDPSTGAVKRFQHRPGDHASLPSNEVFALLEDANGQLWVGTEEGLASRDPVSGKFKWLQHDPSDPHSLANNRVRALYQDRHGAIWVGTFGGGLSMLDARSGRFTRYRASEEGHGNLSNDHVRDIIEDEAGRLWVGTARGLNVLMPGAQEFSSYFGGDQIGDMTDSYVMSLYQDQGGVLWVGTRSGGANAWNSSSWEFGHSKPGWLDKNSVTALTSDRAGYWVGTFGGGLTRVDELEGTTTHIRSSGDGLVLSDDRVMALMNDSQGGLWVGTMEGGINWLKPGASSFTVLRHDPSDSNSLSANGGMSLFEDSRGTIWFGTYGGGVTRFDPAENRFTRYQPGDAGLCGSQGRAFAEDRFGGIWIGTENGLCLFDQTSEVFHVFRHDSNNPNSLADNSVYTLHIDLKGRLWVGTGGGGLSEVRGGLNEPNSLAFHNYSRQDGLSSNNIYAVLSGHDDKLWLSGNNGLTRFDPRDATVLNYGRAQGLQGEEYHYGASHQSADGRLFFGGANGFNIFDPRQLGNNARAPRVVLSGISRMNQSLEHERPLALTRELGLGYRDVALTLEFAALDYTAPQRNQYAYKLDGFDSDWIQAGTRRSTTYTNLPGGNYVFRVRAAGSAGIWSEDALTLDLHVAEAPWNTPWAYLGYIAVILGLLGLYGRAQNRKLQREAEYSCKLREEVRQRTLDLERNNAELQRLSEAKGEFLARMSHEIRSPMNGVLGMAELLKRTSLSNTQQKYATTIMSSAESLLQIIEDILDFSRLDSGKLELDEIEADLEQLLNDSLAMFALAARKKGLQLVSFLPPGGLPILKLDTLRLRQVLVNLLSNAIKFTDRGYVKIAVELTGNDTESLTLRISISDTGIGIAPENQQHIFDSFAQEDSSTSRRFGGTGLGLAISRELIELMGGSLLLESTVGNGATFSFELRLEKAVPGAELDSSPEFQASALIACSGDAERQQLESYLNAWGVRTHCLPTGLAVVEALSNTVNRATDLLFIGSQLPDMPGVELVDRLYRDGLTGEKHIIWLSGIDARDSHLLPPEVCELKEPVTRDELHTLLESTLGKDGERSRSTGMEEVAEGVVRIGGQVLLVEDNPVNQEVIAGMLAAVDCVVDTVPDGRSGVRMARDKTYDVILMDFRLPDIDGAEVTRQIRAGETGASRVPIIALTANAASEDRERCFNAGMDDFLAKPCTIGALAETLGRWISLSYPDAEEAADASDATTAEPWVSRFDELNLARIRGLRRPDGSDLLSHAVDVFFRTSEETMETIVSAVHGRDAALLESAAHKLKSGCANLGAISMAAACRELEEMARRGALSGAAALVEQLHNEHTLANDWLEEQVREFA